MPLIISEAQRKEWESACVETSSSFRLAEDCCRMGDIMKDTHRAVPSRRSPIPECACIAERRQGAKNWRCQGSHATKQMVRKTRLTQSAMSVNHVVPDATKIR